MTGTRNRSLEMNAVIAAALTILVPAASAEDLTLSGFYPSPMGIYNALTSTGKTALARDGGSVSIGLADAAPGTKLHVNTGNSPATARLQYGPDASVGGFDLQALSLAGAKAFSIFDPAGGGTHRLVVSANSYVGIGLSNPNAPLHISHPSRAHLISLLGNEASGETSIDFNNTVHGTQWELGVRSYAAGIGIPSHFSITNNLAGPGIANGISILHNGFVGMGFTGGLSAANRPQRMLHVNGETANTTGVWVNLSDARLKRDVLPMDSALSTVAKLNGVTFRWKDAKKDAQFGRVRGFIAQDVEKVVPEWVVHDADGTKNLQTIGIDAVLVEALKELKSQVDALNAENETLKRRLLNLERTTAAK